MNHNFKLTARQRKDFHTFIYCTVSLLIIAMLHQALGSSNTGSSLMPTTTPRLLIDGENAASGFSGHGAIPHAMHRL